MKNLAMSLPLIAIITACAIPFAFTSGDHEGHDHGDHEGHDHGATNPEPEQSTAQFAVSEEILDQFGIGVSTAELRTVSDSDDQVIAIPKSSLFKDDGKFFIFAQDETDVTKFERWEVTTGKVDDQFIEVLTGVFPEDKVVATGVAQMIRAEGGTLSAPSQETVAVSTPDEQAEEEASPPSKEAEPKAAPKLASSSAPKSKPDAAPRAGTSSARSVTRTSGSGCSVARTQRTSSCDRGYQSRRANYRVTDCNRTRHGGRGQYQHCPSYGGGW